MRTNYIINEGHMMIKNLPLVFTEQRLEEMMLFTFFCSDWQMNNKKPEIPQFDGKPVYSKLGWGLKESL